MNIFPSITEENDEFLHKSDTVCPYLALPYHYLPYLLPPKPC